MIKIDLPKPINTNACAAYHPAQNQSRDLFGIRAKWLRYADEKQLRRLAKLHVRIERRLEAVEQMREERNQIMMCCVRRMRRARGLN